MQSWLKDLSIHGTLTTAALCIIWRCRNFVDAEEVNSQDLRETLKPWTGRLVVGSSITSMFFQGAQAPSITSLSFFDYAK
jgi:hypothetical protein